MSIIIKTEKIIVQGEQRRKIKSYSLLAKQALPKIYFLHDVNYCFLDTDTELGIHLAGKGETKYYSAGMYMQEADFHSLLASIKICGNRLQEINTRLKKENEGWHGEETFVI